MSTQQDTEPAPRASRHVDGLCAICADPGPGDYSTIDGKRVFVCDRCEDEHPRAGHLSFAEAPISGRVAGRTAAALGWGYSGVKGRSRLK